MHSHGHLRDAKKIFFKEKFYKPSSVEYNRLMHCCVAKRLGPKT